MIYNSVLITGGCGFIGSHLAESFLADHIPVTIIDDLSTGRWSNITHLSHNPLLKVIITSADDIGVIYKEVANADFVYHLASAVGVKLIIEQPVKTIDTIVNVTSVVLKACAKYRKPILITSTSEVYGKSTNIPFKETDDIVMGPTCRNRWAYAYAKAVDEFLALGYYHESELPVYIVRLFNTIGTRQTGQYGMVVPTFVKQAIAGDPITIFGGGTQQRCFCDVKDIVRGLRLIPLNNNAIGKVVNLGTDCEISINELAVMIRQLCCSRSAYEYLTYNEAYGTGFDEMTRRVPDLTLAKELIGWNPKITLDETILSIEKLMIDDKTARSR
jgi:UDP-glucose 4-epimerase